MVTKRDSFADIGHHSPCLGGDGLPVSPPLVPALMRLPSSPETNTLETARQKSANCRTFDAVDRNVDLLDSCDLSSAVQENESKRYCRRIAYCNTNESNNRGQFIRTSSAEMIELPPLQVGKQRQLTCQQKRCRLADDDEDDDDESGQQQQQCRLDQLQKSQSNHPDPGEISSTRHDPPSIFNQSLYPEVVNAKIGATEFMSALGMRPLLYPLGFVELKPDQGSELDLPFAVSFNSFVSTSFLWRSQQTKNCEDFLFQILRKRRLVFRLRFPLKGFYTLEIFAQRTSASDPPKNVFNYIIQAPHEPPANRPVLPFPKAHRNWFVAGFVLKEPLNGLLPSNTHSKFEVKVLRAVSVFLSNGGTATDLKEHEGSWWIGMLNTGATDAEVTLKAVFVAEPHVPVPLLSFRVVQPIGDDGGGGGSEDDNTSLEQQLVADELKKLEIQVDANRTAFERMLGDEKRRLDEVLAASRTRLAKLPPKHARKPWHTKPRSWSKGAKGQHVSVPEIRNRERRLLNKLRHECELILDDVSRTETKAMSNIVAGAMRVTQEIRKTFHQLLIGLGIPHKMMAERRAKQSRILSDFEEAQQKLFSQISWITEGLHDVRTRQEVVLRAISGLQEAAIEHVQDENKGTGAKTYRKKTPRFDVIDHLKVLEKECLSTLTEDAKAFIDSTGLMKHECIKEIYRLQVMEMKDQDAWLKSVEMRLVEMSQQNEPVVEYAKFVRSEVEKAKSQGPERLEVLRTEAKQQAQELRTEFRIRLDHFESFETVKLDEHAAKLERAVRTAVGADPDGETLAKFRQRIDEISMRLRGHLKDMVEEIGTRDLEAFVAVRETVQSHVFGEMESAQERLIASLSDSIGVDDAGMEVVKVHVLRQLNHEYSATWSYAGEDLEDHFSRMVPSSSRSKTAVDGTSGDSSSQSVASRLDRQQTRQQSEEDVEKEEKKEEGEGEEEEEEHEAEGMYFYEDDGGEEEEDEEEGSEEVMSKSVSKETAASRRTNRCGVLMVGKTKELTDAVLKMVEESIAVPRSVSDTKAAASAGRDRGLRDKQRQTMKAILEIEDLLSAEITDSVTFIFGEVTDTFHRTLSSVKQNEEANLLQVRKVKHESMIEVKEWLYRRLQMMAEHDRKAVKKLRGELYDLVAKMEKLGKQRIACIKDAFAKNKQKLKEQGRGASEGEGTPALLSPALLKSMTNVYHETIAQLEAKVDRCYGALRAQIEDRVVDCQMEEQTKTNEANERIHEIFWKNIHDGEREVVEDLRQYCDQMRESELDILQDCVRENEETMDLTKTDVFVKYSLVARQQLRLRENLRLAEEERREEIGALLVENPWMWADVKKEEEDRLLDVQLKQEERMFELEAKQSRALASLRAVREMKYALIEEQFQAKTRKLKKDLDMFSADYVTDSHLDGKTKNLQMKMLQDVARDQSEAMIRIKSSDRKAFFEMESELLRTFERMDADYQTEFADIATQLDGVVQPFRKLEEEIREANKVQLAEEETASLGKKVRANLYDIFIIRDVTMLRGWMNSVVSSSLEQYLRKEVKNVEKLLNTLDNINELRSAALAVDIRKMLGSIPERQSPNPAVHRALVGILLTLGDHEGFTTEWKNCVRRITPIASVKLKWRVKKFSLKDMDPRIAKRAQEILAEVEMEDLEAVTPELVCFVRWASAVCDERVQMALSLTHRTPEPADLEEQIQIFKQKYHSRGPVAGPRVPFSQEDDDGMGRRNTDHILEVRKASLQGSKFAKQESIEKAAHQYNLNY